MKTAMQELLVLVEQIFSNAKTQEVESAVNDIINIITQECILKEKEQIEHAHAHHRCLHDKTMECTIEAYKRAEEYYNQTYKQKEKQKQNIINIMEADENDGLYNQK